MGTTKTQVVKYIRKGDKGDPAISISITGGDVVFTDAQQIVEISVEVFLGKLRLKYYDGQADPDGYFSCSALSESVQETFGGKVGWTFDTRDEGYRFVYLLALYEKERVSGMIPFTVDIVSGSEWGRYERQISVKTVFDGEKGERGPVLRGPQAWEGCAAGYAFKAGGEGESWKDVVTYAGEYYSCTKSHTKNAGNFPGSAEALNNGYWQLGDKIELLATKILLTTYALVKNLGVETVEMKDESGEIIFQAKDGNVICNKGAFKNISVSGDITARTMRLPFAALYAKDFLNNETLDVLSHGCNLVVVNSTLDWRDSLMLAAKQELSGFYLRIYEPVITRSDTVLSFTGAFVVGNDENGLAKMASRITPKANTLCEMLCMQLAGEYRWVVINPDACSEFY